MEWVDISVFISSTFNDMHAERDLLLKKVFPVLSEWCAERRIRIYDIDLRWGVTAEDSRNKNTVEVCLRNIDNCRPFFLCFLGQRRGWVPSTDVVNPDTFARYPEISDRVGNHSVTEMEIEHALLAPMISIVEGRSERPKASEHSIFFIRDGAYTKDLNCSQRNIYTNADTTDEAKTDEEQSAFIARVRNEWEGVYDYSCRFDTELYSLELKEYGEETAKGRLTDFSVQDVPMDVFIVEALKQEILREYPERSEVAIGNRNETERDTQERRTQDIILGTMNREEHLNRIDAYAVSSANYPLLIHGKAGSGKTTVLSQYFEAHKSWFHNSIIRYCGSTAGTSSWLGLWEGIQEELIPEGTCDTSTKDGLRSLLEKISKKEKSIIILDGIDELDEGLSVLPKIPDRLPEGVRLILTFRSGDAGTNALIGELEKNGKAEIYEIEPFSEKSEIERTIREYLSRYLKALDDEQIQAICKNPAAHNPLFLKIILRELRIFGSYGQIGDQIRAYGNDPESAFIKVLKDLENEMTYAGVTPDVFIPHMMGVLSIIRGSISVNLLKACISKLVEGEQEKISDTLSFYQRRLGPYFFWDGEHIGISYASLREGAKSRYSYLADVQHSTLAGIFKDSAPLECLYHLRMGGKTEEIYRLSEDISFLVKVINTSGALPLLFELEASVQTYPDSVSKEVLLCLRKTAALIKKDGQIAAALFYKELENAGLRKQAAMLCIRPWIRYERVPLEVPESSEGSSFKTLFSLDNAGCQDFCIATKKKVVYLLKGECDIEIYDIRDGMAGAGFSLEGTGRVRKIECSEDGKTLAAVWEDLKVSLYSVSLDDSMRLLMLANIHNDQCSSVRFGGISLFSCMDRITWQRPDGKLIHYMCDQNQVTEVFIEGKQLAGINACGTVWKTGRTYSLALNSGEEIVSEDARINDAVLNDEYVFLAAENQKILVFDYESGKPVKEYLLTGESLISLTVCDSILYGVDRYGAIVRIIKDQPEYLGRITRGEDILDMNTRLSDLSDGRLAFVSLQRRAVISLSADQQQYMRLMRVCPGKTGNALIWDDGDDFMVIREDNARQSIPYPKFLLEGRNINEKNNLKIACAGENIVYEENSVGIHLVSSKGTTDIIEESVSEMGGILCDLQYSQETGLFAGTGYRGLFMEIDTAGNICSRIELPDSESNLHHMCVCGAGYAILSRGVHIKEDPAASAYIVDVLSMIKDGKIRWQRHCKRNINGMLYDSVHGQLILFYFDNNMERIKPDNGELMEQIYFPSISFHEGAAAVNDRIYYVGTDGSGNRFTVRTVHEKQELSLPSQRRVRHIIDALGAVFIQEGNDTLYRIYIEE